MIHRAIFGSFERFIGVLIEHFSGNFPTWLAPVQVVVIPISEKHLQYATKVYESLINTGVRVNLNSRSEKMGAKIRESEYMKIPYMLVVDGKETENSTVSVRKHLTGDHGQKTLEEFIKEIKEEITDRRLNNLN